jgi:hypothetical protein
VENDSAACLTLGLSQLIEGYSQLEQCHPDQTRRLFDVGPHVATPRAEFLGVFCFDPSRLTSWVNVVRPTISDDFTHRDSEAFDDCGGGGICALAHDHLVS